MRFVCLGMRTVAGRLPAATLVACGALISGLYSEPHLLSAEAQQPQAAVSANADPLLMLVRDPAVQAELKLKPAQIEQLALAVRAVDQPLWVLRDLSSQQAAAERSELLDKLQGQLETILDLEQRQRLAQIRLQAVGLPALARPAIAQPLELSEAQVGQIRSALGKAARPWQAANKQTNQDGEPASQPDAGAVQRELSQEIYAVLNDEQRRRLAALVGRSFDFSQIKRLAAQAPEFAGISEWINSPPLRLADKRGEVVALHFFAFG